MNVGCLRHRQCRPGSFSWQARDLDVSELNVADGESTAGKGYTLGRGAIQPLAALRWRALKAASFSHLSGSPLIWPATASSSASGASQISLRVVHFQYSESSAVIEPHVWKMASAARPVWMAASNHIRSLLTVDCCWDELELVQASVPGASDK